MRKRFLIIENIKNPMIIELKFFSNNSNYLVCPLSELSQLPNRIKKLILKQGLFMTEKADREKYNPLITLHRLVCCIKYNIKNLTIHHIDKNKRNNHISNLFPITQEENNKYELLEEQEQVKIGKDQYKKFIQKQNHIKLNRRNTLSNNNDLQKDILLFSVDNSIKRVIKKFRTKIKTPQTIRNIINYYFYAEAFINWLKTFNNNE